MSWLKVDQIPRWLALCGAIGPVTFVTVFTGVGFTRPGYSAIRQPVSELGVGQYGWQLNLVLIMLGALLLAFVAGFRRASIAGMGGVGRWSSAILLALPAVGFAAAGIFPLPNPLHWLVGATLVFIGSVPALAVTGFLLRNKPGWRGWGTYSIATAILTLVLVVAMFAVVTPSSPLTSLQIGGLVERVVFLELLGWYSAVGWRLFRTAPTD